MRSASIHVVSAAGICLSIFVAGLLGADRAFAATRRVPSEYPTIQAGIQAAVVGDTILVAPGTYFENVVIDRRVALVSEAGAEVTTIDGQRLGTVITVLEQVDHAAVEGFRVTHGNAETSAGGISVRVDFGAGGYATIRRNIIEHNYSGGRQGGLFAVRHAIVQDNIIQYNNEQVTKGIAAMEVSGIIERNIIRNNRFGFPTIQVSSAEVFAWNTVVDDDLVIYARFVGGGTISNNTFALAYNGNAPWTVSLSGSIPFDFRNNVIVHSTGGGLACSGNGSHVIRCNDVWGAGQSYMGNCAGLNGVDGNFSADPLFCDASNGDYRLSVDSPCASAPGCGLIGALPVGCGVTGMASVDAPIAELHLTVTPNPVRGAARFDLGLTAAFTTLDIFDSQGRLVEQLPGRGGHWEWTPRASVPAGVYFAVPEAGLTAREGVKFLYLR